MKLFAILVFFFPICFFFFLLCDKKCFGMHLYLEVGLSLKRFWVCLKETYIKKVLERFRMHYSYPIDPPMEKGCTLSLNDSPKTDEENNHKSKVPYAATVWSLMYTMLCTRPDI